MSNARPFWFRIPQRKEDLNNGNDVLTGYLKIWAIGYTFDDGTFRSTDIESVTYYRGMDPEPMEIRGWLVDMDPEKWEEITGAADTHYKTMLENVASAESGANNSAG